MAVNGYGVASDTEHITEPDPTGQHPARAMKLAFADAGINPEEIDYINAHGTSTPLGDASETRVIKRALGKDNARKTPVSSTKGATGPDALSSHHLPRRRLICGARRVSRPRQLRGSQRI